MSQNKKNIDTKYNLRKLNELKLHSWSELDSISIKSKEHVCKIGVFIRNKT